METPLDELAFLANSDNRVDVLHTLACNQRTRSELVEVTDASRFTVSRILKAFEDREWIARNGQYYELTPLGNWLRRRSRIY